MYVCTRDAFRFANLSLGPTNAVIRYIDITLSINSHNHSIIAIQAYRGGLKHDATPSALKQLSPYLSADTVVAPRQQQVQECFSLILGDIIAIPLRKGEQALMPNNRQLSYTAQISGYRLRLHGIPSRHRSAAESQEVEYNGVDDLVGKRVFLVEERLDEDVHGAGAIGIRTHLLGGELAETVDGGCGVQDGDTDFCDDGSDDYGFALGAGAVDEEGEHDSFEEGGGFVESVQSVSSQMRK